MAHSLRQIKNRIRSITNTGKVTSAMSLISVAKLNRIDKFLYAFRPYSHNLESLLRDLAGSSMEESHPFFEKRTQAKKVLLLVITSDNGLCGSYNNNVMRSAEEFIKAKGFSSVDLITVGTRGMNYFKRRGANILHQYTGLGGAYNHAVTGEIVNILTGRFTAKQADEVYVSYMHYESAANQKAVVQKFLNIEAADGEKKEYILEQSFDVLLEALLAEYLKAKMRMIFLEAFTSEHAARSLAMRSATDNAKELLDDLVLLRNKVRQASITQDMLEIISSSEALRG